MDSSATGRRQWPASSWPRLSASERRQSCRAAPTMHHSVAHLSFRSSVAMAIYVILAKFIDQEIRAAKDPRAAKQIARIGLPPVIDFCASPRDDFLIGGEPA